MRYLKFLFIGDQVKQDGGPVQIPPVNYENGALWYILIGCFFLLTAPLIFVQSSIGFIPFDVPKRFSNAGFASQYTQSLGFNIIYILKTIFPGDGFPPEMPIPATDSWKIIVSIISFILNGIALILIGIALKKLLRNHRKYKRRAR